MVTSGLIVSTRILINRVDQDIDFERVAKGCGWRLKRRFWAIKRRDQLRLVLECVPRHLCC